MAEILAEVGLTIVFTFILALILVWFRQPTLVAYLLAGMLLGPFFLNILSYRTHYELLAHIGIATLLFIVGLQLNLTFIRNVGKIAIITGIGQILFTSLVGVFIVHAFGYDFIPALIIAVALTFSSTIIIVKLLTEKNALDTLYGRISLGFLLVQDAVAVVILLLLSSYTKTGSSVLGSFLVVIAISVLAYVFAKKYLGALFVRLDSEMQILLALSWCLGLAGLMQYLGFSIEIGSLLAGVTLASSGQSLKVAQRLEPFRDFFLIIFFVFLGAELFPSFDEGASFSERMGHLGELFSDISLQVLVLSAFVVLGNPLIVFILLVKLRYRSETAFNAGLAVSQISEFSVIITLLARNAGIFTEQEVSLITFVAIVTIISSTYLFHNSKRLYKRLQFLDKFQHEQPLDQPQGMAGAYHHYVFFGVRDLSMEMFKTIKKRKKSYIIFDSDFHLVKQLKNDGLNAEIGDATDPTFLEELNFAKPVFVISSIADLDTNMELLDATKRHKRAKFVAFAKNSEDADFLLKQGAYEVIFSDHLVKRQISKTLRLD